MGQLAVFATQPPQLPADCQREIAMKSCPTCWKPRPLASTAQTGLQYKQILVYLCLLCFFQFLPLDALAYEVSACTVTDITSTSATISGAVRNLDDLIKMAAVEYWLTDTNKYDSTVPSCSLSSYRYDRCDVSNPINGLQPGQIYSCRIMILSSAVGPIYGDTSQFQTLPLTTQTISFGTLANQAYGTQPFAINATASSTLPVAFSSLTTTVCTVNGRSVSIAAAGTCTIAADQSGDGNYNSASQVTQSFTVNKANQSTNFVALPDKVYGDSPFVLTATASSGLTVAFASTTPSVCTVNGNSATIAAAGTCTLAADQTGDGNYNAAPQVGQSFASNSHFDEVTRFPASGVSVC